MDLKPFVGKEVFVQLKGSQPFIQVTATEGRPGPLVTTTKDEQGNVMPQVAMAPMIFGTVEERRGSHNFDGSLPDPGYFIVGPDPNPKARTKIRTAIAPDLIAFVSEVVEPSRIIS